MNKTLTDSEIAILLMGFVPGHQIHDVVKGADRVVEHLNVGDEYEWAAPIREALATAETAEEAIAICDALTWGFAYGPSGTYHVEAEVVGWAA